ncbi:MAG: orotidine-5'-phosphate decarboxylase [Pyrodictiaceae archaeon]
MQGSRIIVALDKPTPREILEKLVSSLCDLVSGYKIGLPLLLVNGVSIVGELREQCPKVLWMADLKLADIGYIMSLTASVVGEYFDAIIAHSFVGYDDALDKLKEACKESNLKLVLVYSMTHKGALEIYMKLRKLLAEIIRRTDPWGIIAPATLPEIIKEARALFPGKKIFSPGIGAQGARPGQALCAGADYEIIGRMIVESSNPRKAIEEVIRAQEEALQCRTAI